MLRLEKVTKTYDANGFRQDALKDVSVSFRESEFVSILGPSGSGKTTLLNIIGGLDQYTSGNILINGVSTKQYKDKEWDSYRNHRIGFIFQNYNLIPHQTILENVELALTLSGISKKERRKRALSSLEQVGLKEHIKKKPNQLSGGQMQRVAIARALVNNPDIILADEPTGALDSETADQIMDTIKQISKNKLIIMVTHNPDIAEQYSDRIIKVKDGKILSDSKPHNIRVGIKEDSAKTKEKSKKTSMNMLTALSLSLKNLMSKKGRTILTSFAGSIGIIGIALILSLSNGVQLYIDRVQKETLSSYPISIEAHTVDMSSVLDAFMSEQDTDVKYASDKVTALDDVTDNAATRLTSSVITNNLKDFKVFIENNAEIKEYANDITYSYNTNLMIFSKNQNGDVVKVNPNTMISDIMQFGDAPSSIGSYSMTSLYSNSNVFKELIGSDDLIDSQYEVVEGRLPQSENEVVLVVNKNNTIPLSVMYALDFEDRKEIQEIYAKLLMGESVSLDSIEYDYSTILNKTFKVIVNSDMYVKENGVWVNKSADNQYMSNLYNQAEDVKIVGIMKVRDDAIEASSGFVGYKKELLEKIITRVNESDIAKEQIANPTVNIFTNQPFDGIATSYENNLSAIGVADINNPSVINIYPENFEAKEKINKIIEEYNNAQSDDKNKIQYTDISAILISSVSTITDIVSYVLIAFVAISLIVSSIMIAIITYISVLERTKEIGVLRAIGASKRDISRVFNAETIIEGFSAGLLGIIISILIIIPANTIIENILDISNLAQLPLNAAIILIIISVILTVIAGLIPSKIASRKNPVEALRSE